MKVLPETPEMVVPAATVLKLPEAPLIITVSPFVQVNPVGAAVLATPVKTVPPDGVPLALYVNELPSIFAITKPVEPAAGDAGVFMVVLVAAPPAVPSVTPEIMTKSPVP